MKKEDLTLRQRFASISRFRLLAILLVVMIALLAVGPGIAVSSTIPTISITSVERDNKVVIQTHNYPPNQNFVVTMGPMGSRGINGFYVTTINSGAGGSSAQEFTIPAALHGSRQIAIRLQSPQGYYSFNWFYNNTTGPGQGGLPGTPGYTGIPTFRIVSVNPNQDVTIETHNFPAGQSFRVTMGPMGTRGVNGIHVGDINSAQGGVITATFPIPASLHGSYQISIRAQTAHARPYYAFNWFYNDSAGVGGPIPQPPIGYAGIPTFKVCEVTRDGTVTILTNNFPPNQEFTLRMGPMYTAGIGGTVITTFNSGNGDPQRLPFTIPANLHGSYRISIRAETGHANPFFAYNWFFNNSTTQPFC